MGGSAAARLRSGWAHLAGGTARLAGRRHGTFPGVLAIFVITVLGNVVGATVDYTVRFGRFQSSLTLPSSSYLHSILLNPGNAVFLVVVVCWLLARNRLARIAMFLAAAVITFFICDWVLVLVTTIPEWKGNLGAGLLLVDAVEIWVLNVFAFATWYWLLDGGGAERRGTEREGRRDFSYPQQAEKIPLYGAWHAGFNDYLHVAFMLSTSFTAGTVHVLSARGKNLNMLQSLLSIALVAMAIGRAIATFSSS